jgi:hypothetical protein
MEETVKNDILQVLRKTVEALEKSEPDTTELKKLSNNTIHNASIYQDEHSISIAILLYSLSKIIERVRDNYNYSSIKHLLELSIEYLEDDNIESYHDFITKIFELIKNIDSKFKLYIQEVIRQSSIRKGGKMYEHGISSSKTAELLGVSLWDLYEYLGAVNVVEIEANISSVRDRLKFTRLLFE